MRLVFGAALLAGALPSAALAQASTLQSTIGNPGDFKLSGSVRLRYETLDGQPRAGLPPEDEQLALRSTLFAEYDAGTMRVGAELYDSRAWLERPGSPISANEVNTFELVQAYLAADFDGVLGEGGKATLQAGRFTMNLGSRRLVAADDYRNTIQRLHRSSCRPEILRRADCDGVLRAAAGSAAGRLPSVLAQEVHWDRENFDLRLWGALVARPKLIAGATCRAGICRLP